MSSEIPTGQAYLTAALGLAERAARTQLPVIQRAAVAIADALAAGQRFWAFGTGHSHLIVEEIWGRAGGLADVTPILEPALMLHEGLQKSSLLERQTGLAATLLDIHPVAAGDCLLVISNSGRNSVPVEVALGARKRGATVIALTSTAHSSSVTSRVPTGERLFEVADLVIDNCGVPGDAVVPDEPHAVGATSTMVGAMLVQALTVEVVGLMRHRGQPLQTLRSLNA
ncbi:sugar isomerase domain-containing protein [Kribbella sp. GL6]|uniref:sugar isomerase domain-containing protein n=1 Tax=Kribbella sp. GL6 TaxID=3419765 RepID=UPI003D091EA3